MRRKEKEKKKETEKKEKQVRRKKFRGSIKQKDKEKQMSSKLKKETERESFSFVSLCKFAQYNKPEVVPPQHPIPSPDDNELNRQLSTRDRHMAHKIEGRRVWCLA